MTNPFDYTNKVQGREVIRVPLVKITIPQRPPYIAPHMSADARVIIDRPEVVAPGLKLGDWSQVDIPDVEAAAVAR
jgi:hypothetical protein